MGMTEQAAHFRALRTRAEDIYNTRKERIRAWCEWGRMSKNVSDMAKALREIDELNEKL